jgi:U4/U6.U5 tri-snRNP-associated protein 2
MTNTGKEREDVVDEEGVLPDEPLVEPIKRKRRRADDDGKECPYLDTIDRYMLDFDFEKVCSVSLSNLNVYACLVCGKYFQG